MHPPSRRPAGIVTIVPCIFWLYALPAAAQESPPTAGTPPSNTGTPNSASPPSDTGTAPAEGKPPPPQGTSTDNSSDMSEIEAALGKDKAAAGTSSTAAPASSGSDVSASLARATSNQFLDLSFILDVAAAAFSSKEPLQQGDHDPTHNGFNFQQLEMSVRSVVDPYFRFDSNIVLKQEGVEVEEAYVTSLDLPANLQVRAGQFLTRFGRLNNTHPHAWDFVDQPFAFSRVFGGDGNRGLGVEGSWLTPLPWYVELVGSVTDAHGDETARSFLGDQDALVRSPFDFQFTGAVKQFFPLSDDLSLMWGLSSATGPNSTDPQTYTNVFGTDVYLKYRPTTVASDTIIALQAELLYRYRHLPDDTLTDYNGYAQVLWRFAKRWAAAGRYEFGTPARGKDGEIAMDPLDPEWTATRQRVSANVTFWPTEFSRLRLQAATDHADWRSTADYSVFLTLEAVVGAHGAHSF